MSSLHDHHHYWLVQVIPSKILVHFLQKNIIFHFHPICKTTKIKTIKLKNELFQLKTFSISFQLIISCDVNDCELLTLSLLLSLCDCIIIKLIAIAIS